MKRTVCELFAGVGGFRCGLNYLRTIADEDGPRRKNQPWETVWFNQWEPAEKKTQYAHECYVQHFGDCLDLKGEHHTNDNIEIINKANIPDHNLLVGGFPCQDYSVAGTLASSKGINGTKGVLWWSIRDILEAKAPPFVLLENVDRLLKSPASQRGRDFGIILSCFRDLGYIVEWRIINAADYGFQQRRRRTFIFAYKKTTRYASKIINSAATGPSKSEQGSDILLKNGFFASVFAVKNNNSRTRAVILPRKIGDISNSFSFPFENSGIMLDGKIYTVKTSPDYAGAAKTLGDIMETADVKVDELYFIPTDRLYYDPQNPSRNHTDETKTRLPLEQRKTWQYLKGAKRYPRTTTSGYRYIFTEGAIPMIDSYDKPARTMLTSEGSFSRTTHIVKDKRTGRIRLLTANEAERIQGFPTDHTRFCKRGDSLIEMPLRKRRFMMGNALVVDLIRTMEPKLSEIFDNEG